MQAGNDNWKSSSEKGIVLKGGEALRTAPAHTRGDRLYPKRSSRVYWHLSQLRDIYQDAIRLHLSETTQLRLVDFGCGNMPYRPLFADFVAQYKGCDFAGNEMADCIISPNGSLPFPDSDTDIILSSQVLEHVRSPEKYLGEAFRVLKPGGLLFLSTHGTWQYHPDPLDLWRWTSDGLKRLVTDAHFDVVYFRGVLCAESAGLQLWQDAVGPRLSPTIRRIFYSLVQWWIKRVDIRCDDARRNRDASVYVVVAKKRNIDE